MDKQVRILCVDDEENVLKAVKRLFLDEDYEILTATSGEEALEILNRSITPIQIVLADYRMPGMNGVEFLGEVYTRWPDTIRIVVSGYADTPSVIAAINEGQIYRFIPKPWNDNEFKITIARAVDLYFLNKRNRELVEELKRKNNELQKMNNELERLVSERTSELVFQNQVLKRSQNILDALPVAVVGIDQNGVIVQCNKRGLELFTGEIKDIMGRSRRDFFPEEVNKFIDKVMEKQACDDYVFLGNVTVFAKGTVMKYPQNQKGIILIFDTCSATERCKWQGKK